MASSTSCLNLNQYEEINENLHNRWDHAPESIYNQCTLIGDKLRMNNIEIKWIILIKTYSIDTIIFIHREIFQWESDK